MRTLITGFGSDLSQALSRRRRQLGDEVILTSSRGGLETEEGVVVPFDLKDPQSNSQALLAHIEQGFDCLILVAASKVGELRLFHEWSFEETKEFLRTNIEGNAWLLQRVLPQMMQRKFGRILFMSSLSAATGTSNYGVYCAAKAAMEGLIFNLAVDYAEYGIFSNVLRPGILATSRTEEFWSRPGYQRVVSKVIPAGQVGTVEQVAEASDVLLSETSYINGAILDVAGGLPRIKQRGPW